MSVKDDRAEFAAHTAAQSHALGADEELFQRALNTNLKLADYDYSYLWTWLGVPIIQVPPDILATQEVIWNSKPDVIIETGVARGGSVIFLASMLQLLGSNGFVIGVDIEIRPHNLATIESHPMSERIRLVQGDSSHRDTLIEVKSLIPKNARVMVILDSNHSKSHVLAELRQYGLLVSPGCYLVIADTYLGHLNESQAPTRGSQSLYKGDEPLAARNVFLSECDDFAIDETLNGKLVMSSSPGGYLKCLRH